MLQITNMNLSLEAGVYGNEAEVRRVIAVKLKVREQDIMAWRYLKRSIDARRKNNVHYVAKVLVTLNIDEKRVLDRISDGSVSLYKPPKMPEFPSFSESGIKTRPVVVGSGPAGLFSAQVLAWAGARPVLIERGADVEERAPRIARFVESGDLDTETNIQFGEGGAGAFSDGKLTTGTSSPYAQFILKSFVDCGAPKQILWQAKPHIGSDILPQVVKNMRKWIIEHGGEVYFHTRLDDLIIENGKLVGIECSNTADPLQTKKVIETDHLVLATGHSARDTLEMLSRRGVELAQKPFSMGVRIEHSQEDIDRVQYGRAANTAGIGAASYKLFCHLNTAEDEAAKRGAFKANRRQKRKTTMPTGTRGLFFASRSEVDFNRGVYTFCMCPGGSVLASASEEGGVVTNGASRFARRGPNANSGLLVSVAPEDFDSDDPMAGIRFQREWEHRAYDLGGGAFRAPAQLLGDFMDGHASTGPGEVRPTYPRGVTWTNLEGCLPLFITRALKEAIPRFANKLHGFDVPDAVLTGIESRSSSPVRVERGSDFQSRITGLYPCGEGAGYAGGIMSAAADGIAVAISILGGKR